MQVVEKNILDRNFSYEEPWFYNNDMSLRCELGVGEKKEYLKNAKKRALAIQKILFTSGIDCIFFNHFIYDYDSDENITANEIKSIIKSVKQNEEFSIDMQYKYPNHKIIRNIKINEEDDELIRVNRIIAYTNNLINIEQVITCNFQKKDPTIHLVSFKNKCILSIYDERGCDVVFFDKENYIKYYKKLEPYFLEFDKDLMKKRYLNCSGE